MKRNAKIRIRPAEAGMTLSDFLTNRFSYHSRAEWLERIRDRAILLNHGPADPDVLLKKGDALEYLAEAIAEPPVNTGYSVICEDDAIMVVNKPGNLPCHPGGRYFNHTLWALLRKEHGLASVSLVNRIDRETSGLVLIAKTPADARNCQEQFLAGQVGKRYLVLVEGDFPAEPITKRGVLAPDPDSPVRKKRRFYEHVSADSVRDGQTCHTRFQGLKSRKGLSLVEAEPRTGRLHQIRATLCSMGYPVVGDKIYGVDDEIFLRFISDKMTPADRERLRMPRQALHAAELRIRHPRTGSPLELAASLPRDMRYILSAI
ncbi:pseudouridine synthase [Desulfonema ishimotonii]|uniref:Pseudouridine synthase n=1 Tax=Desulfonema ishimotonii TaxID=45657 RepID=A0A401FVW8_9BACT|nr:RluA family pseudouridine synthase [Desulfonema ishimotonii]GBC61105.1 pseudouridine synthase [Desulfonema ishimotonii]